MGLDDRITKGKYKSYLVQEVLEFDEAYLLWAAENEFLFFDEEVLQRLR